MGTVVVGDFWNFGGLDFLVAGRGHLEGGGEIGPELEAVHAASVVALGHFLVNDAAAGGHPLHVAGGDGALIAHAVAVFDGAGEDVSDGLDAAMRVPGEAGEVVLRDIVAEVVKEKEGIEIFGVAEAEGTAEVHAGALAGGLGFDDALDGADGHGGASEYEMRECGAGRKKSEASSRRRGVKAAEDAEMQMLGRWWWRVDSCRAALRLDRRGRLSLHEGGASSSFIYCGFIAGSWLLSLSARTFIIKGYG